MGSKSKSSTSSKTTSKTNSVNSTLRDDAFQNIDGNAAKDSGVLLDLNRTKLKGSSISVVSTDNGAVSRALDTVDGAVGVASSAIEEATQSVNSTLSTTKTIIGDQVNAIKKLATELKVGDIESGKWIAFAIIVAVVLLGLAFIFLKWRG